MKTAVDIILDLVSSGTISNDEAKILLEAINEKGGTTFVPVPYEPVNPYYPPYRQGDVWYTTGTTTDTNTK